MGLIFKPPQDFMNRVMGKPATCPMCGGAAQHFPTCSDTENWNKYTDDEILALTSYARGIIEATDFVRERQANYVPVRMWHMDKPSEGLAVQFVEANSRVVAFGYHVFGEQGVIDAFKIDLDPVTDDDDQIPDIEIAYLTGSEALPFGIGVSFHGDKVEEFWYVARTECIYKYDAMKMAEREIYMLMRKKHFEGQNDDPNETPTEF